MRCFLKSLDSNRKIGFLQSSVDRFVALNEERIRRGDAKAGEVYEAMAYQIAKWVGASAAVLSANPLTNSTNR